MPITFAATATHRSGAALAGARPRGHIRRRQALAGIRHVDGVLPAAPAAALRIRALTADTDDR